jgi:hypothetical protein
VGAPEINGEYEFVPNTSPLKWKSATGAEIEASRTEPNKLELWMGTDFKASIIVSHDGVDTTLKVDGKHGKVPTGVTATFKTPLTQPVADGPQRMPGTPTPRPAPVTNAPTPRIVTNPPAQRPVTSAPTQRPVTNPPAQRPVTSAPTQRP